MRLLNAGAYILAIDLKRKLALDIAALAGPLRPPVLVPGRYVYCGSAYGAGGPRACIARHLKRRNSMRWHVDRLSTAGHIVHIAALAGGSECALIAGLCALPGTSVPLPGFGSSDCRVCAAHLAAVPADFDIAEYLIGFRSPA